MSRLSTPEPALAETDADARLARDQRDVPAMLAKADHRMRAEDYRAANAYYVQVGRLAAAGIPAREEDIRRARTAAEWLADLFRQAIIDGLANEGIGAADMHPRFAKSLEIMFGQRPRDGTGGRYPQMPNTYYYPDLPLVEYADLADHGWVAQVERASESILAEAEALLAQGQGFGPYVRKASARPQGDVHGMLEDASWSTLDLTEKGLPVPARTALAPMAWETLSSHAPLCDIPARAPSLMFSLLRAGARIPPHTGMVNTRYICHLPLIVPGNGGLRVGGTVRAWEFGKLMVFDDSVEHEAWNHADTDRLVLIFDIWRPEMEPVEREQVRALFRAVDAY